MLIYLSSHHNLAVGLCSPQSRLVIAFLCGTLKGTIFLQLLQSFIRNSGLKKQKQKQNTWDSEYISYWNQQKKQGMDLFLALGHMLPDTAHGRNYRG